MDYTNIVAVLLALGGAVWGLVQWYQSRKQSGTTPTVLEISDILKKLVDELNASRKAQEIEVKAEAPVEITRMGAFEHVEALAVYLEKADAKEGLKALQTVTLALMPIAE